MTTYVLIHGAWHWGGCWVAVEQLLTAQGHRVYTPTLVAEQTTTIEQHVAQVSDLLTAKDLRDITLVGHSYGGIVAGGVLAQAPERIAKTVFLDAMIPLFGKSALNAVMPAALHAIVRLQLRWKPLLKPQTPQQLGITDAAQAQWLHQHLRPHPARTLCDPFPYQPHYQPAACHFIACHPTSAARPKAFERMARSWHWSVQTIITGHDAMLTAPNAVANALA